MIVKYKENGWEIITQRAHGIVAAQAAAHWKFTTPPRRWTETLLAIAEHDDAENELDGENLLTPAGGPLNFDMKNFELAHCQKLSSLTLTKSRYMALLTSMHMVFLYSKDEASNNEAKVFLNEQRKLQEQWRKELGLTSEEIQRTYSLLEWCDAFSLLLCKEEMQPEKRRLQISTGPDGKEYYLFQVDEQTLSVEPWPFSKTSFEISYERRMIQQIQFASSEEFRKAFLAAPVEEKIWKIAKKKSPRQATKNKLETKK